MYSLRVFMNGLCIALVFLLVGCVSLNTAQTTPTTVEAKQCSYRVNGQYVLPDPVCTPGFINQQVTQANIHETICKSGWSSSVRPPVSFTEPLKLNQMKAYGATGSVSSYEEDHEVPLEVGGNPFDTRNLWPEPISSARQKDQVENAARVAVCSGRISLADAQHGFMMDWSQLGNQLGVH